MIWNGGRVVYEKECSLNSIIQTIEDFNSRNISLRFTCTNTLIDSSHLNDKFANTVIDLAHNGKNEILVNSPILENYLRSEYPNFKYISSTTKCLLKPDEIEKEANNYFLTVLDYRLNKNLEFLKTLDTKRYELLINSFCSTKCTCRKEHYNQVSAEILHLQEKGTENLPGCAYIDGFFNAAKYSESFIHIEELYSTYTVLGFEHFKIEGRNNHIIDILEAYLYYMIKPEYKDFIRYLVLRYIL